MQCPVCGANGVLWVDNNGSLGHHFKHEDYCPVIDQTPPRLASFLDGLHTGNAGTSERVRGSDRVRSALSDQLPDESPKR